MEFMISVKFRPQDQTEILARIPQEQARIKELREQGIVEELYIGSDLSQIWFVMQGELPNQIRQSLESLPLYSYMEFEVTPLSKM